MAGIFKFTKQNNGCRQRDISLDKLETLVKASGDSCVAGYVRYKKIKPCGGFKEAKQKAAFHLSRIKGGRPMGDNQYAAVAGFRLIVFLIPVFLLLMAGIFLMWRQPEIKATEIPTDKPDEIILPDETAPETFRRVGQYEELYICVPGYSDCIWDEENHGLLVYNPQDNRCIMEYVVYASGQDAARTELLPPGESAVIDFYDRLEKGVYSVEMNAKSYSFDRLTEFNSVYQKIQVTVY